MSEQEYKWVPPYKKRLREEFYSSGQGMTRTFGVCEVRDPMQPDTKDEILGVIRQHLMQTTVFVEDCGDQIIAYFGTAQQRREASEAFSNAMSELYARYQTELPPILVKWTRNDKQGVTVYEPRFSPDV